MRLGLKDTQSVTKDTMQFSVILSDRSAAKVVSKDCWQGVFDTILSSVKSLRLTSIATFFLLLCFPVLTSYAQQPKIKHVILIGIDGLGAYGITENELPCLEKVMEESAYTLKCQAVLPTSSSPNWASMMMGATPAEHGVTSNAWKPKKQTITPACTGKKKNGKDSGIWPTIYSQVREAKPDARITVFNDWWYYDRMIQPTVLSKHRRAGLFKIAAHKGYLQVTKWMAKEIRKYKPTLAMVHIDVVDHVGHDIGHKTPEYHEAVRKVDAELVQIFEAIKEAGIENETAVIITSDHGGDHPEELNVPWIIKAPGVKSGELSEEVKTYDTASTILWLLGIERPACWIGKPITSAFQN